jgi:hypothetical protein
VLSCACWHGSRAILQLQGKPGSLDASVWGSYLSVTSHKVTMKVPLVCW